MFGVIKCLDEKLSKAFMARTKLHNNFQLNENEENKKFYGQQRNLCVSRLKKEKRDLMKM